jgi:hypothetical protein
MADKKNKEAPAFTKDQLLASKKYANRRDILNALLVAGETYTIAQVDALIEKYMKGPVK